MYVDVVKLANGELEVYVGSGTNSVIGLLSRFYDYSSVASSGHHVTTAGLHLDHAPQPGSTMNLRLVATTPLGENRVMTIYLEALIMTYLRSFDRTAAGEAWDKNPESMSKFIQKHGVTDDWNGLNKASPLKQGYIKPSGHGAVPCHGCNKEAQNYHTHWDIDTNALPLFQRKCRYAFRKALLRRDPVRANPSNKCERCFIFGVSCKGGFMYSILNLA